MVKKVVCIGLLLVTIFLFAGCVTSPENNRNFNVVEDDYFKYAVHKKENYAIVYELTDLGKEQKVLAIPSYIKGKPVTQIGWSQGQAGMSSIELGLTDGDLKKVYVPETVDDILKCGIEEDKLSEVVLLNQNINIHMSSQKRILSQECYDFLSQTHTLSSKPANLQMYYNYTDSSNSNIYWIDLITGTNLYLTPPSPGRAGYTFTGWYLDEECTEAWDEVLPKSKYEKLSLFAGWNKI